LKDITANQWTFRLLKNPLIGDINEINHYVEGFNRLIDTERYVVIESLGDARVILRPPVLSNNGHDILLTLTVKNPPKYINPKNTVSLALINHDLSIDSNGNIAVVRGTKAVIQDISTLLGSIKGESSFFSEFGSVIGDYFKEYKHNLKLLSRLFKLELIRLSFVHFHENSYTHIKRIDNVNIQDITPVNQRLNIEISVVLENDEQIIETISVFVSE
jgi:hypothetical protein